MATSGDSKMNVIRALGQRTIRLPWAMWTTVAARFPYVGPQSLTNRILLLQVIWTLLIYVLVITALWFAANLAIENTVRHRGADWITKLDEMGMPIYAANKPARLQQAFGSLRDFPEVAQVRFLDETGKKVLTEYARKEGSISEFAPISNEEIARLGRTDVEQKTLLYENGKNSQMRISAPVWIKSITNEGMLGFSLNGKPSERSKTIGYIQVVLDYSSTIHDINRSIFNASMFIAAMMLVVTFVTRVMVRRALQPLAELEGPLTRLAHGETDVRVDTSGDEEIARIGIALNTTISAIKERDEELRRLAVHDALTGLINRAHFVERLGQEIKRVGRGGPSAALYFFDLDRFKNINDTYGHAAGDRLLVEVTRQLSQRVRGNDLFARYGGDEFTLLAYNVDEIRAEELAESFIALMHEFVFYEAGNAVKIYFSIGITMVDDGNLSVQEYLNEADAAVHQAKSDGRNCYRIYERKAKRATVGADTGWHRRLEEALSHERTILYYQPLAAIDSEHEHIYEVLLRLPDEDENVITPGLFMSAAERFGLMGEFDRQVITKAVQVLAEMDNVHAVLSLNLSEQFFARDDVAEFLDATFSARRVAPRRVIFELSQNYVVRNVDKLKPIVALLAKRGFRFAIDDFSADFGSFNYIRNFPAQFLKIEGALIENIAADRIAQVCVRAIVQVAKQLGIITMAKNVADDASIALLREMGVNYVQGHYIAAPAPELKGLAGKAP